MVYKEMDVFLEKLIKPRTEGGGGAGGAREKEGGVLETGKEKATATENNKTLTFFISSCIRVLSKTKTRQCYLTLQVGSVRDFRQSASDSSEQTKFPCRPLTVCRSLVVKCQAAWL